MNLTPCIIGLALLTGCGRGYKISELYIQRMKDSEKSIVEYNARSTVNDGYKSGFAILDKNEKKSIVEIEERDFRTLAKTPEKDTIFVIGHIEGGSRIPKYVSSHTENYKGLIIRTDDYQYSGGPYNLTYNFSNFKETKDNLTISGIEKDYFNLPTGKKEITFKKGNIKIVEVGDKSKMLKQVEIFAFLSDELQNSLIDNQTILKDTSLDISGLVWITFKPLRQIKVTEFSNFGIYKQTDIKDAQIVQ